MIVIQENQIGNFLEALKKDFDVFDIRPPTGGDKLPFKKYFFPPVEETFTAQKEKTSAPKAPKKFILFGLNFFQLEALNYLDEIMKKPNEDFFYFQKREHSFVIGLVDFKIDFASAGDMVFEKFSEGKYKVWAQNSKVEDFIKKYKKFFEEENEPQIDKNLIIQPVPENQDWSVRMRKLLLDPEALAQAVENSKDNPIWDELAQKCLGCGICTYVCPICHCFSIEDTVKLDDSRIRCRKWASCILSEFSRVAGGHNFRPDLKQRYYAWFYHKFVRAYKEYGRSQCVGCGACKRNCPAGIDIKEILERILSNQ